VAVLTSGGDAPGMNAAVRAVVGVAGTLGLPVLGVRWGYQGLVAGDFQPLQQRDVDGWQRRGGSELGSARVPEFKQLAVRARAIANLHAAGAKGLIVVGGDGSLTGAHALAQESVALGLPLTVVGVPASIDNDIGRSTMALGVDTAMNTIMEACDRIHDTASSHARTFVVEVMGRNCGYLAMTSAVAAGADRVLFRELGMDEEAVVQAVLHTVRQAYEPGSGKRRVLVIKSEGVGIHVDELKRRLDAHLEALGHHVDTRVTVLGHVVRGGAPSAFDRLLAGRLGHAAVRAVQRGMSDVMTGWHVLLRPGDPQPVVFDLDPFVTYWPLEDVLRETQAVLDGSSPVTRWRVKLLREVEPFLEA
jgi:6-phosphofructokinase 1